jgi:hypothetical protein
MKTTLLLIALMFSTPVFARIGETTGELDKRYGKPLETNRDKVETRRYSFRGYTVLVGLDQGISQFEMYRREDNFRMTEPEIQGLLQANVGKSEWLPDPDENLDNFVYWSKDKKTRLAIYTLATHRLMVTSKKLLPRFANLIKSIDQKKMEGF